MSSIRNLVVKPVFKVLEFLTTAGVASTARMLWYEVQAQMRHWTALHQSKKIVGQSDLRLNIGCGNHLKPGWINIDLFEKKALNLDVREDFPFRDNSIAIIYSEHFFEHLEFPSEVNHFLSESLRCLKPGGLFSVGVPDAEWAVTSYGSGDQEYFENAKRFHPNWCDTRMHALNYHFRQQGEHKYAYDLETLAKVLSEAGFVSINLRAFDPSLDSEDRRVGTIYIDAHRQS